MAVAVGECRRLAGCWVRMGWAEMRYGWARGLARAANECDGSASSVTSRAGERARGGVAMLWEMEGVSGGVQAGEEKGKAGRNATARWTAHTRAGRERVEDRPTSRHEPAHKSGPTQQRAAAA
jgi:hypothetical protein